MTHPNGDSPEPVFAPGSAPVPAQPTAPAAESYATPTPVTDPFTAPAALAAETPAYPAAAPAPVYPAPAFAAETPVYAAPAEPPVYAAPAPIAETPVYTAPAPVAETPVYAAPALVAETPVYAPAAPVEQVAYPATAAYPVTPTGAPVGYAPVSAVPGYAPVSAIPGYAPVSAIPGYAPVSAIPGYGYPPVEAPKKKSRAGIIVLSIATVLLALAAAGMTTLYFVEHTNRATADKNLSERSASLTEEQAKTKDLDSKLQAAKAENTKLTQDIAGAKGKTEEVQKEKEALAGCFRALDAYFASQTKANATAADTACDEAAKYY